MVEVAVKLPKEKLIEGLASLPFKEVKEIIDAMIQKKLFQPPTAKRLYEKASKRVKTKKLPPATASEAVKWARSRKS